MSRERSRAAPAPAKAVATVAPVARARVARAPICQVERSVRDVQGRYPAMHVAADFQRALSNWVVTVPSALRLPLWNPLRIAVSDERRPVTADVASASSAGAEAAAGADAEGNDIASNGKAYSTRVLLFEGLSVEKSDAALGVSGAPPLSRALRFLLSKRGSDLALIGGKWSKALDGGDPAIDDAALIETAIRCVQRSTGIDLERCAAWAKFMEISYERPASAAGDGARTEVCVVLVPSAWDVAPDDVAAADATATVAMEAAGAGGADDAEAVWEPPVDGAAAAAAGAEEEDDAAASAAALPALSEADVREMKVSELRGALRARSLSAKGVKKDLVVRLLAHGDAALSTPEVEEGEILSTAAPAAMSSSSSSSSSALHTLTARRAADAEKRLRHKLISLDGLLDYNLEDKSETTFEVSLVAEAFDEMLQRDFGLDIAEALEAAAAEGGVAAPATAANVATTTMTAVNRDYMTAFRFFDRKGAGVLAAADLKQILHNLPARRTIGACLLELHDSC